MCHFSTNKYQIIYYTHTKFDYLFYHKTYELGMKYPYKWYDFIHNIMNNPKVTYYKDTTLIITLIDLEIYQVKILFEFLKEYLKERLIKKVLYHREFLIVHFFNNNTINVFKVKNLWMSIYGYYMIKSVDIDVDLHLLGVVKHDKKDNKIDLILHQNDRIYLINSTNIIDYFDDVGFIYLNNRLLNYHILPKYYLEVPFTLHKKDFINSFHKVISFDK